MSRIDLLVLQKVNKQGKEFGMSKSLIPSFGLIMLLNEGLNPYNARILVFSDAIFPYFL